MRLDKWLWVARFYKSRSLARQEIERNRVKVNDGACKPSRELHAGDRVQVRADWWMKTVVVLGFASQRSPASEVSALFQETEESIAQREGELQRRKAFPEPAHSRRGRPEKRERRDLEKIR